METLNKLVVMRWRVSHDSLLCTVKLGDSCQKDALFVRFLFRLLRALIIGLASLLCQFGQIGTRTDQVFLYSRIVGLSGYLPCNEFLSVGGRRFPAEISRQAKKTMLFRLIT